MRSVALEPDGRGGQKAVVSELPVPKAAPGEILVEMRACGLCGTDIEKMRGHYTASKPVLGHEAVGVVAGVGEGVAAFSPGDRVFPHHHVPCYECHYCRSGSETMCPHYREHNLIPGGFSEFFRVPAWNVSKGGVLRLPDGLGFEEASLVEPLACCVRGVDKLRVTAGEAALVVGAGPVGMMLAILLKSAGAKVMISDVSAGRLRFGGELGMGKMLDSTDTDVPGVSRSETEGRGVDLAFAASGSPAAIRTALDSVRNGGRVCLFGVPPTGTVLDYDISRVFNSEISVLTTYGAAEDDTKRALDLISSQAGLYGRLVTHRFHIRDFGQAVEASTKGLAMKVVVTP